MTRVILLLFFVSSLMQDSSSQNPPNILIIIGDDMGVDVLNGYGLGTNLPATPHIDALRASGITFKNAWAAPVCSPTRAAILTGKYGINNGVENVPGRLSSDHQSLFQEIADRLGDQYKTCVVGKWHLSRRNDLDHPYEMGVDNYMGVIGGAVEDYYQWNKVENSGSTVINTYVTSYFTDYAIDWIEDQSQPWLLWMAHVAPHTPYHVPPDSMYTQPNTDSRSQQYLAMIESLDFEIGRLLQAIPEEDLDNTVIIFIGDNGTPGNVLQTYPEGHGKGSLYQGGIHVPFIVTGKGVSRENETEEALINVTDLYTTILQLVDPSYDSQLHDSYSFKHLLDNKEGANREYNYMGIGADEGAGSPAGYTVRNEAFKLIKNGEVEELYHLPSDPYELDNLLAADLTNEQKKTREKLDSVLQRILGTYVEDTTSLIEDKIGKFPVVHTGVQDFYSINDLLQEPPGTDQYLYWQDAGRVQNPPSYQNNGDGTISDEITGLMWEQEMGDKMTYAEAVIKANNSTLGGYDDWRIPSIKELYSLILFTGEVRGTAAITHFLDESYFNQPLGDVDSGEREIDAQTWSNTHYQGLTFDKDSTIFGVNFIDGRIKGYPKYLPQSGAPNSLYFRMVRGNMDYGKNIFIDNQNGTVTDSATMLMWQKADDGLGRDWISAIEYCENLELGGYDDWHLPHAKELHSIVDYTRSPSATQSPAIDPVFETTNIQDPDGNEGHYPFFWTTSPHLDGANPYSNAVYIAFGEALGRVNGNLLDVHGAGAQRSDPKTGNPNDFPKYQGPQGDLQIVYNHCRCVRNIEEISTSVLENVDVQYRVYPNPSNSIIYIESPKINSKGIFVQIYDLNGKVIFQKTDILVNDQINIEHLPDGMYFMVVNIKGEGSKTLKFIKSN